ncbi:MAG: TRAP transporter small permease subunit [Alphaproteobacteria bacterium]
MKTDKSEIETIFDLDLGGTARQGEAPGASRYLHVAARVFALSMVALVLLFVVNNYLTYWWNWTGVTTLFAQLGWFGLEPPNKALSSGALALGWMQLAFYVVPLCGLVALVWRTRDRNLRADSTMLTAAAAYLVRGAFWAVLLVGAVDALISFSRIEDFLQQMVGDALTRDLGRPSFRGVYVHYPLVALGYIIAAFTRSLGFFWLALLVVIAEFMIVITRYVFSYEQAFMGDLVRFWYAALFLFASAYTLLEEGHVRVDVLYTNFSDRAKAWSNTIGTVLLGMPICWIILTRGLWGKSNIINAPLLSFEVTQSGYGMYVKYLMASFLLVYAVSMLVQFSSFFLSSVATLVREPTDTVALSDAPAKGHARHEYPTPLPAPSDGH